MYPLVVYLWMVSVESELKKHQRSQFSGNLESELALGQPNCIFLDWRQLNKGRQIVDTKVKIIKTKINLNILIHNSLGSQFSLLF